MLLAATLFCLHLSPHLLDSVRFTHQYEQEPQRRDVAGPYGALLFDKEDPPHFAVSWPHMLLILVPFLFHLLYRHLMSQRQEHLKTCTRGKWQLCEPQK